MLGIRSTGNATLIAYDGGPVLATDPWLSEHRAYFGSWVQSRSLPTSVVSDLSAAKYIWFSHGHPDHLNPDSLKAFRGNEILLADHAGQRIYNDLNEMGFKVRLLPDGKWVQLSRNVSVMTYSLLMQDSALLVNVGGRLFINLNDSAPFYHEHAVRQIASRFKHTYLMMLGGYGDADMINYHTAAGDFIRPAAVFRPAPGEGYSYFASRLGATHVLPSSSFHRYARTDSNWANEYATPEDDLARGLDPSHEFVPPFCYIDCVTGQVTQDETPLNDAPCLDPSAFGDSWSDELSASDVTKASEYFRRFRLLADNLGAVELLVGGRLHRIRMDGKGAGMVRFECPAYSLMTAVNYEIFDDLLIGKFMKTTVFEGSVPFDFSAVSRYGDNGRVFELDDIARYRKVYAERDKLFAALTEVVDA